MEALLQAVMCLVKVVCACVYVCVLLSGQCV